MPRSTRSKKAQGQSLQQGSPAKAFRSPGKGGKKGNGKAAAKSPPKPKTPPNPETPPHSGGVAPNTKSNKKNTGRMDRMEQQIAALTSLVTAHLTGGGVKPSENSPPHDQAPVNVRPAPLQGPAKPVRRERTYPPAPEAMVEDTGLHEQITEALKRLDPHYKATGGKKNTVPKPHFFVPKRHKNAKAGEQEDIPFPQFVTGMAGMVLSMIEDQSSPAAAACRHLREAADDHITRPWSTVREWSKTMFERMTLGEIMWDDYDEIQRERLKICLSAPPTVPIIVPCPKFSAGNCEHSSCHDEGTFSLRHICPFCYASGAGRQDHPIFKCNSKKAYNTAPKLQFNKQQQKQKQDQPAKN